MDKKAIDYLAGTAKLPAELVEKDMLLHRLLLDLCADKMFRGCYAFKGGTCLTKCHYGYYRFSEDLDFTFLKQGLLGGSGKQARRAVSAELKHIIPLLEGAAASAGLDFKPDKGDKRYAEFGGGNRFATFKLWYDSPTMGRPQFIKVQVNFAEKLLFPAKSLRARSFVGVDKKELEFLFPDCAFLADSPEVTAYDAREILAEKLRAMLTRRGVKARDYLDVYVILGKEGLGLAEMRKSALEKTMFMLKYEKYQKNLLEKSFGIAPADAEGLLLSEMDMGGFPAFAEEIKGFLSGLKEELLSARGNLRA